MIASPIASVTAIREVLRFAQDDKHVSLLPALRINSSLERFLASLDMAG